MSTNSGTKVIVSNYKNEKGEYVSHSKVVHNGQVISHHTSKGTSTEAAAKATQQALEEHYSDKANLSPTIYPGDTAFDGPGTKSGAQPTLEGIKAASASPELVSPNTFFGLAQMAPPPKEIPKDEDGDGIPDFKNKFQDTKKPATIIKGRNHVPWWPNYLHPSTQPAFSVPRPKEGGMYDGMNYEELFEPVPEFLARPGDVVIKGGMDPYGGIDNNATIILGRDRSGYYESWDPQDTIQGASTLRSGFSNHMAAGAIDIVVGRMAPYPIDHFSGSVKYNPIKVAPIYRKLEFPEDSQRIMLVSEDSQNEFGTQKHPGLAMDAARIYMSQMSNADNYFALIKNVFTGEKGDPSQPPGSDPPNSCIVQKADEIRLYSRKDIKLITGGDDEAHNSQGNPIRSHYGIHLVAGNGDLSPSEPIPLGDRLVDTLDQIFDICDNTLDLMEAGWDAQQFYNGFVMNHFHPSPLMGMPTAFSPTTVPTGVKTQIDHFARVRLGILFTKANISRLKTNWLSVSGENYVNSLYNTTN